MDKFDELSNNDLRDALKSRGFGNFPVTDTTRNALIRKLRNAVNGPAKPAKGRRETMSVAVKHSSAEESESDADAKKNIKSKTVSSRRATIAAHAPKSVNKPVANILNGISNEKVPAVPVDNAPAPFVAVRSKSPSRKTIIAPEPVSYFEDASDDDLVAAAEEVEKLTKVARKTRTSRSPSLTKSSVVTTSYKHTIEPLVEHNNDLAFLNDHSDAEYNSEMLEKIRKPSTPTTKITSNAQDDRRKTLHVGPSISTNYSSIKPVDLGTSEDKSTAYRRYTSYAYNSPAPTVRESGDSNDDILKKVETPFLSNFTRRLAELKAEPLPGTDTTHDSEPIYKKLHNQPSLKTSYSARTYDEYRQSGRTDYRFQQKPESKWSVLEKKIRWPLFILIALFVVVALYVFLFSNN